MSGTRTEGPSPAIVDSTPCIGCCEHRLLLGDRIVTIAPTTGGPVYSWTEGPGIIGCQTRIRRRGSHAIGGDPLPWEESPGDSQDHRDDSPESSLLGDRSRLFESGFEAIIVGNSDGSQWVILWW